MANFYSEVKGQKYAVEAMRLLPRNYELSFFGDGIFLTTVKDLAIRYGLEEGIRFLGGLDNRTMREKLVEYDAIVVPSESESFGIVAIEGMAAGLPVIASGVGGLSEVVTEDCGLLVPAAKPRALADGIRLVCESPGSGGKSTMLRLSVLGKIIPLRLWLPSTNELLAVQRLQKDMPGNGWKFFAV